MKSIFQSKTAYLGLLVALIPFLEAVKALPLSENSSAVVSIILGFLIILNRIYTTKAIK